MKYFRHKENQQTRHQDDWLMTYADMITLLLCFFAVFLSVSVPKKDVMKTDLPQEAAQIAKPQPIAEFTPPPMPALARTEIPVEDPTPLTTPVNIPQETAAERKEEPAAPAAAPAPAVEEKPASLPEIVDHLKTAGPADIQQKGDRLTTMEMNSAAFFGSGSASLSEAGKGVLRQVAVNINSEKFRDYQITVEGHTDDTPIKTLQFPSNWELSTARASAVVHFFLEQGIPAQRLRAAGYADTFPKSPNRDANGNSLPANQAQNRRVVIKLEKIDKSE